MVRKRTLIERTFPRIDNTLHKVAVKSDDELQAIIRQDSLSAVDVEKVRKLTDLLLLVRKVAPQLAEKKDDSTQGMQLDDLLDAPPPIKRKPGRPTKHSAPLEDIPVGMSIAGTTMPVDETLPGEAPSQAPIEIEASAGQGEAKADGIAIANEQDSDRDNFLWSQDNVGHS